MDNEFNPFDLSAQKPKTTDSTKSQTDKPLPKPIVRRVSMGPIFHSRIIKIIALTLGIILAGLLGYTGMNYYLTQKAANNLSILLIM
jgi:hypothetical protein